MFLLLLPKIFIISWHRHPLWYVILLNRKMQYDNFRRKKRIQTMLHVTVYAVIQTLNRLSVLDEAPNSLSSYQVAVEIVKTIRSLKTWIDWRACFTAKIVYARTRIFLLSSLWYLLQILPTSMHLASFKKFKNH